MEVDEIQRQQQVCKFQKITSNGDNNSSKLATQKANHHYFDEDTTAVTAAAVCGWPSSRIVRVSRASGGKDRHSKVLTSKGLRDRRVRLSVTTAIQFYDLQDRLGYDQPSKAVEWLIKAASSSISELPSLDPSFSGDCNETHHFHHRKLQLTTAGGDEKSINETEFEDPNNKTHHQNSKSSTACSSTSENSKGSGVSLSRSENRIRARERAREMAAKKEKEKDGISQNSSFTDLLTGGGISSATVSPTAASPESRIHWTTTTTTPMDYFFNRPPQMPQFNGENHHFSFLQENFSGGGGGGGGGGEGYNLNFSIASSSSGGGGGGVSPGFNRGTLQSNYYLQRFQSSSMVDGSTSTNFPFFIAPTIGATTTPEHFPATGYDSQRLQLYGGADGGRNHSDHRKEKSKN